MNPRLKNSSGIYLITPDCPDTERLCAQLSPLLRHPIALLQYRNKLADGVLKHRQAEALLYLCRLSGVPLIINDDWRLALAVGADGVHLGAADADPGFVRQQIGTKMIIGVSCYNDYRRAETLSREDIDYLAFGAIYSSQTKPEAQTAELGLLQKAKDLHKPIVAIGGLTPDNSAEVIAAGADFIAVISGVFAAQNPGQALNSYLNSFQRRDP